VVIGGSVGNLPQVHNVDIQYAQSAVYSPSDFAFPHDAIIAESTPNTEMALIADLNLDSLYDVREKGSVTNGKDRRTDLYSLVLRKKATDALKESEV
jgi:predicted amidohydrolase